MPTPSLILVPARFKTGKLYTPLATTSGGTVLGASGDFNVTRATAATRVNASGYIESVASGIPRLDYYTSGGTAGCPALLVEPSAQNLILQSAFATSWSTGGGATITPNSATSPENQNTAAKLNVVTTTFSSTSRTLTTVSGTVYTVSVFAKKDTKNWIYFVNLAGSAARVWFNVASGTVGTIGAGISNVTIENYGNGWYRCRWTETAGGTTSYFQAGATDADNTNTPTSSGSVFLWGAQVETGSVATSYIPTTTAAVTRNADVISVSGAVSGCIGQTEGTIYAEVDFRTFPQAGSPVVGIVTLNVGANNLQNCIVLGIERQSGGTNRFYSLVQVSNATQAGLFGSTLTNGIYKIALTYKQNDFALYVNGTSVATDNSGNVPACSEVLVGTRFNTDSIVLNDRIRAVALYTTRLTNAQLAALTT